MTARKAALGGNRTGAAEACRDPHLLLDSWLSRVEEKLWFLLPSWSTMYASSVLLTWTQRRSKQTRPTVTPRVSMN